jgi:hypothetical protein
MLSWLSAAGAIAALPRVLPWFSARLPVPPTSMVALMLMSWWALSVSWLAS